MNLKLHNKFEIITNGKTYTAYNTMLHKVFDCIKLFDQYATYFAVGIGELPTHYNQNKLFDFRTSFPSTLEEIQCDPSKNEMYVKRVVSLDENTANGLQFCEIGIANSNADNADIYNRVLLTDSDGEAISVVKEAGLSMLIRVTIYLELTAASSAYLTAGDNLLVKAILGELPGEKVFTACRGYNLQPNQMILRNTPRNAELISCTKVTRTTAEGNPEIEFKFDFGNGEVPEAVILLNETPVARMNLLEYKPTSKKTKDFPAQSNYVVPCEGYVKEMKIVHCVATASKEYDYTVKNYANDFTDYIAEPFDAVVTGATPRWVSKDGDKIAFLSGDTLYVYKNQNYGINKLPCSFTTIGLTKVILFEQYLFCIYSNSPYLKVAMYNQESNVYENLTTDFSIYEQFDTSYDWKDIEIINDDQGNFIIGLILSSNNRRPVVANASIIDNVFKISSVSYGQSGYIVNMFSLYKNSFCESMIGFITNNHNNTANTYRIEEVYVNKDTVVSNQLAAYYLVNGTSKIEGKSRAVIAKKTAAPYIWLYYYPQVYRYSISLTEGVENWISTSLLYLIQKYTNSDGELDCYKIYNLTNYNNPQEFINGFPEDIDQSEITDFEFLDDTLLIFTNSDCRAINLKAVNIVVENVKYNTGNYILEYDVYNLLGRLENEGVSGTLTITFTV